MWHMAYNLNGSIGGHLLSTVQEKPPRGLVLPSMFLLQCLALNAVQVVYSTCLIGRPHLKAGLQLIHAGILSLGPVLHDAQGQQVLLKSQRCLEWVERQLAHELSYKRGKWEPDSILESDYWEGNLIPILPNVGGYSSQASALIVLTKDMLKQAQSLSS